MNENAEMTDKKLVQTLKEKVDPLLAEHLGGSELVDFENGVARVRLTGACHLSISGTHHGKRC